MLVKILILITVLFSELLYGRGPHVWNDVKGLYVVEVKSFDSEIMEEVLFGNEFRSIELDLSVVEHIIGDVEERVAVKVTGVQSRKKNQLSRNYLWAEGSSQWSTKGYSQVFYEYESGTRFIIVVQHDAGIEGIRVPTAIYPFNKMHLADMKAALQGEEALLTSEFPECTATRVVALFHAYNRERDEDRQKIYRDAFKKFAAICQPMDYWWIAEALSSDIIMQVGDKKDGSRIAYDRLDEKKEMLVFALQHYAEKVPEKRLMGIATLKQRHSSGAGAIQRKHFDAVQSLKISPKQELIESWFLK
jgi:hypothetical protein